MASKSSMSRRSFMTSVGTATVVPVMLGSPASAAPPHDSDEALARLKGSSDDTPLYLFFNAEEGPTFAPYRTTRPTPRCLAP